MLIFISRGKIYQQNNEFLTYETKLRVQHIPFFSSYVPMQTVSRACVLNQVIILMNI